MTTALTLHSIIVLLAVASAGVVFVAVAVAAVVVAVFLHQRFASIAKIFRSHWPL